MKILCAENKNRNPVSGNLVRVFLNRDYSYGYWVDEVQLFDMLTEEQKNAYSYNALLGSGLEIDVSNEVVQKIIEIGINPYKK